MAKANTDKKLTPKQQAFVDEYIIDFNATQAAIRAGYSAKSADVQASKMLVIPKVAEAVSKAMDSRNSRTKVNSDYVIQRLVEIDQMDVADILNDDGTVKFINDWPKVWRQYVSGVDVAEMMGDSGDGNRVVIGMMKKIKWPDKLKNIELLGRHTDVQAWVEKSSVDVLGEITITRRIVKAG